MKRFFRYSLEHNRAIRMIYLDDEGKMHQVQAVVEKIDGERLSIYVLRPPRRLEIPMRDVLSCDYTRQDEGMA